jgi:hypothetical protein
VVPVVGRQLWSCPSADVNVSDDLPNGSHLEVNDAIELRADDTQVASGSSDATLSASESHFAHIDGQLGDLHADALCHRPAVLRHRFVIFRQLSTFRAVSLWLVLGRVGQPTSSLSHFAVRPK